MLNILTRSWWAFALSGVAAILFGILAFIYPHTALIVLVALFGAYALVDGVFSIITAAEGAAHHRSWIWPALQGVAGIIVGIITFATPNITALALLYLIAAWAIVIGGVEIYTAIQLRRELTNEWLLILAGALSVLFGLILLFGGTGPGLLTVVWLVASYAIIVGTMRLALGFRLHSLGQRLAPSSARR